MSLRDEIAKAMCAREESAVLGHWKRWIPAADALMPLVERAVLAAAVAGWLRSDGKGPQAEGIDAIVARVTGEGEL